jgi:predicted  nucleic acid-binding Zn-ribbon protein
MPEFNEQLAQIAQLRAEAREHEEGLYAARIALSKAKQRGKRAGHTIASLDRDAEIAPLREQMAQLKERLTRLQEEDRRLKQQFDEIAELRRIVERLNKSLATLREREEAIRRRLAELRHQNPPPQEEIDRLTPELEALEQSKRQLDEAIREATRKLEELQHRGGELRERQEELRARMESAQADVRGLQGRVDELSQPAFDDRQAIDLDIQRLERVVDRYRDDERRINHDLSSAVSGLYFVEDPHPRAPLAQLSDQTPFLLFPVRLETVFATTILPNGATGTELQVRVYPDEIFVHTHESTLTEAEVDAGRLYWTELVVASHLRAKRAERQGDAWRYIVNVFGGQRASWIARNTKPADWATLSGAGETQSLIDFLQNADPTFFPELLALPLTASTRVALNKAIADNDSDAFIVIALQQSWGERINSVAQAQVTGFPTPDLTRTDAWSRAPRSRVMPDRFVLLLYRTLDSAPQEQIGALIPDTVFIGPDPLAPNESLVPKDGALTLGGKWEWISNFNVAVEQGLAFRIPLTDQEAKDGFARVVVLGLKLSATAEQGAQMLEELIGNHQFSPKGFSLVAQGTPTNNTERDTSGYSDNDPYDDLAFFTEHDAPAFDPADADPARSQTDGRLLADALGISYEALQTVQNADQTDVLDAQFMNVALFPATLGYWLKNWMSPVVTPEAALFTRTFFTRYVIGRGPLPAIRVGNQPYGVLVTSDLSRWKYRTRDLRFEIAALGDDTPRYRNLLHILQQLDNHWTTLSADVACVGPDKDSSDMLIKILGLHPTSVEFYQRVGFHVQYLSLLQRFRTVGSDYSNELYSLLTSLPPTMQLYLKGLGIEETVDTVKKALALGVLWQHYTARIDVPNLVEAKPLSELNTLAFNYIDWLAKAESVTTIIDEDFGGAKNPASLLYLMLRNALLLQLHHGSYDWLDGRAEFDNALQNALRPAIFPNVRSTSPSVSKFDLMTVSAHLVEPQHPAPGMSVADWIWSGPTPAEAEGAYVQTQREALAHLAKATTARLERCFVEHLDCCNYRLDAWETAIFAQRLEAQRGSAPGDFARYTGVYLGAFGWIEDLKRTQRVTLRPDEVPESLRPTDLGPLLEEDDVVTTGRAIRGSRRGGFTHAPSINHAAAAALLRNAYLTHATSENADALSNNLSSDRVRRAQFVLEGMRNGQPIEALLGYQFERALHDLTSESAARRDVPVLELNQFIQPYRIAFPFEAREIVQAGTGAAAETIPPYSVVNGLAVSEATIGAANGFGLQTVLTAQELPGAAQGAAIISVRERLRETIDAVKDLLMAENAYQLVQGNFDRVAAVSLAQKDARVPPSLEVLNTPRGSQFTFTNRVTLHFDSASAAAASPWVGIDPTPRAKAEPGVNLWLGKVIGLAPGRVCCQVRHIEKDATGQEIPSHPRLVTLADLEIQPIDFIAMTGINTAQSQGGATELETRIAVQYRSVVGIADNVTIKIDFGTKFKPDEPSQLTFAQLFPLARRLRSLFGECRPLNAQDFLPAAGGKAMGVALDKTNLGGYDVAELRARVQAIFADLENLADRLDGPAAPGVDLTLKHALADPGDDESFSGFLGDAFTKLDAAGVDFSDTASVQTTFAVLDAQTLRETLSKLAFYGISDAYSPETDLTSDTVRIAILSRARRVARRLRSRSDPKNGVLDRASVLIAAATPDKSITDQVTNLLQAGQILFSETLKLLPRFVCYNEVDLAASAGSRSELLSYAVSNASGLSATDVVDQWLQGVARVRPRIHAWDVVCTLADALNDAVLHVQPVQVPYRTQDRWLAVEFPDTDPLDDKRRFGISRDTLSIAAHGDSAFRSGMAQRGLLLDEWTEEIPTEREITGISFRFNQPNAVPPQTLLLAVTPEETGSWAWDGLVGTLKDTLARAKRRAVEPAQLEKSDAMWNVVAPALVSEFTTLDQFDVSLDLLNVIGAEAREAPISFHT